MSPRFQWTPASFFLVLVSVLVSVIFLTRFLLKSNSPVPALSPSTIIGYGEIPDQTDKGKKNPGPVEQNAIEPDILALSSRLNSPDSSPNEDLEILNEFFSLYRKVMGGNPVGLNEDITAALTGTNDKNWQAFPANHPAIKSGQIHDRWGSPYWFHPISGSMMEIRSAGPDNELFTQDDVTGP